MKWVKNAQTKLQAMVTLPRECGPAWRQLARYTGWGEGSWKLGDIRRVSRRRQNRSHSPEEGHLELCSLGDLSGQTSPPHPLPTASPTKA